MIWMRNFESVRKIIKPYILKVAKEMNIDIEEVLLFGSRARGSFDEKSDWDILVIVAVSMDREKKQEFIVRIRRHLPHIPMDIIVKGRDELKDYENFYGTATREALKEGIPL